MRREARCARESGHLGAEAQPGSGPGRSAGLPEPHGVLRPRTGARPGGGGGRSELSGLPRARRPTSAAARPRAAREVRAGPTQKLAPEKAGRSSERLRDSQPWARGAGLGRSRANAPPTERGAPGHRARDPRRVAPERGASRWVDRGTSREADASRPNQGREQATSQQRSVRARGDMNFCFPAGPGAMAPPTEWLRPALPWAPWNRRPPDSHPYPQRPPFPSTGAEGHPFADPVASTGSWALRPAPGPEGNAEAAATPRCS